jgi:hypothetical protein
MPAEPIVETPETQTGGEEHEFGTPLNEIFAKAMPMDEEIAEKPEKKEPSQRVEPEKGKVEDKPKEEKGKKEPKKEKAEEKEDLLSDLLTTVKTEETPKVEDEVKKESVPEGMKGKAAENFDRIATKAQEWESKAKQYERQLKDSQEKSKTGDPRLKQLEDTNKDLLGRLERAGIEHHPWFEQNITIPRENALKAAQKAFEDAGGDPKALSGALRLEGKARAERLDELLGEISSQTLRGKVERAVDVVEAKDTQREQILANREPVMKRLQEQDAIAQKNYLENHAAQVKTNLEDTRKYLLDKHNFFVFKTVDDPKQSWWNEEVTKMEKEAEDLMLNTSDPKQLAVAANLAVTAPRLMTMLQKEIKARKQAEKERDAYRDSEPSNGAGDRKAKVEEDDEEQEQIPFKSSIINSVRKAQAMG